MGRERGRLIDFLGVLSGMGIAWINIVFDLAERTYLSSPGSQLAQSSKIERSASELELPWL